MYSTNQGPEITSEMIEDLLSGDRMNAALARFPDGICAVISQLAWFEQEYEILLEPDFLNDWQGEEPSTDAEYQAVIDMVQAN